MRLANVEVDEGAWFDLLGRFTTLNESPLLADGIDDITVAISDRSQPNDELVLSVTFPPNATNQDGSVVWYDTLQTGSINPAWKEDNIGYNFRFVMSQPELLIGGHTYRGEVSVRTKPNVSTSSGVRRASVEIKVRALRSV